VLFSIITITRNNLQGLQRTCDSIQKQSFQGFEWLVIDGASDDGTIKFLENMKSSPPSFILSEPDDGIYDAMNKGIAHAGGFYLIFLNAGDVFANEHTLEDITATIQDLQETPDFIYGDAQEERSGKAPAYKPARPYTKIAEGMFTHHQAMIYRHDLVKTLRYDITYKISADYKFTLQFLERSKTIVYCPFPLCLFESGGISQQQATLGRTEQFKSRQELKIVSPLHNHIISLQQKIIWELRKRYPSLYWRLKSKSGLMK